jgi:hypothetical protein
MLMTGAVATVTGAATRYGFMHMGRFAAAYRGAFGEAHSVTLESARRQQGP